MQEEILAIKCKTCGGVMSPDQKTSSFICPFCRNSVSWFDEYSDIENFYGNKSVFKADFKHLPLEVVDEYVKLGRVEVSMSVKSKKSTKITKKDLKP